MAKETQETRLDNRALESAVSRLQGLSHESQALIIPLIDRLAEAEGVSIKTEFKSPLENIGHWLPELDSNQQPSG